MYLSIYSFPSGGHRRPVADHIGELDGRGTKPTGHREQRHQPVGAPCEKELGQKGGVGHILANQLRYLHQSETDEDVHQGQAQPGTQRDHPSQPPNTQQGCGLTRNISSSFNINPH